MVYLIWDLQNDVNFFTFASVRKGKCQSKKKLENVKGLAESFRRQIKISVGEKSFQKY